MSDASGTAKVTRKRGLNKTETSIKAPSDVRSFLKEWTEAVKGQKGKMFNSHGPVSGEIYDLEEQALIRTGVLIADALGTKFPNGLVLLSNCIAQTSYRVREDRLKETYGDVAKRQSMSIDEFAKKQDNPKTGKKFGGWDDMCEFLIASEIEQAASTSSKK